MIDGSLAQLTLTRVRMFVREPSAVFWTFGFPVILSLALGIAFRDRPPPPVEVIVEAGPSAESVRQALAAADVRVSVQGADEARRALYGGKGDLVVVPAKSDAPRAYVFDDTRPASRAARLLVDDRLQRAEGRKDPSATVDRRVTERGARYIDFLLPGIIGMNVMQSGLWGIGFLIVEMRTKNLMKRMVATPMRRSEFLVSFVLMRMLVLGFELPVFMLFGYFVFDVRVRGSLALFALVVFAGALAFAGVGLLVASRARNTQTVQGLINLVSMPMFILSGIFFASTTFPDVMQPLIRALPLTALNEALRAVTNEGAGLREIARPMAVVTAWGAVSFAAALRLFLWK